MNVKDFLHRHICGLHQANLRQLDLHLLVQQRLVQLRAQLRLELHRPRALQGLWRMILRALYWRLPRR